MKTARFSRRCLRSTLLFGLALGTFGCGASESSSGGTAPGTSGSAGSTGSAGTNGGGEAGTPATMPGNPGTGGSTGTAGTTGTGGGYASGGTAGTSSAAGSIGTAGVMGTGGAGGSTGNLCGVQYDRLIPEMCTTPPCQYVVTPSTYLEAGPTSVLRLHASLPAYPGAVKWEWTITGPDGSPAVVSPVDATTASIEIKTDTTGSYTIIPTLVEGPSCFLQPFTFGVASPSTPSFMFRATPPASSLLPTREVVVAAADVAGAKHPLELGKASAGNVMSFTPVDPRGIPAPSYVRVTSLAQSFDVEAYTGQGPLVANLPPELTYDVLVVPDGPWAPLLVRGPLATVAAADALVLSAGIAVKGEAKDASGAAVAGARVLLRQGARPSTLGVTAADGTFALLTREGTLGAVISPPLGLGLAEAHVAANPGIPLAASAKALTLRMQWAALPSGILRVTARGPGGSLLSGARVRAESSAELSGVGTLHVELDTPPALDLGATGSARADGVTDATGVANLGRLPAGPYHITVAPPEGGTLAVTSADVTVPAAGLSPDVAVASLVTLSGTLTGADATAGWKISAIDHGALAPVTVPQVTTHGAYSLQVSPGRPYELVVETASGNRTRTFVLATGATAPSTGTSGAVPGPLVWTGTVTSGMSPVAGAFVEVFCVSSSTPACLDPAVPVAQGLSQSDGTLTLLLPDLTALAGH